MKKSSLILFAAAGLMTLASCSRDTEIFNAENAKDAAIKANVEKIFGVTFNPNQDWCMTTSGKVTLTINTPELKDVAKVQILTTSPFGNSDCNGAQILNQKNVKYGETVTLYYDAPKAFTELYAACVMNDGQYFIQQFNAGEEKVVFEPTTVSGSNARQTRSLEEEGLEAQLAAIESSGKLVIYSKEASYNNNYGASGWDQDYLYAINPADETSMFLNIDNYSKQFRNTLKAAFAAYLPNKTANLPKIRASHYSTYENYPFTTGEDPIVVAPVFKNDGTSREITYCDLYYYYFPAEDLANKSDAYAISYIQALPKYKAIDLKYAVKQSSNNPDGNPNGGLSNNDVQRLMGLGIVYWGDGQPKVGEEGVTTGTFKFPKGYKIGFIIRSRDYQEHINHDGDMRQGELYADSRMNAFINQHGHFANSGLGDTDPRMAWFWCNGKSYLMCETGCDQDFNDMVFQVIGGVLPPPPSEPELAQYLFCYEDRSLGDYDLNDVVLKYSRKDATTIVWSVLACGANDELYIENIDGDKINSEKEVHSILGSTERVFINTVKGQPYHQPVSEEFTVPENYTILDPANQPNILDMTTNPVDGDRIFLAKRGEDPHAIMIPCAMPQEVLRNFYWPEVNEESEVQPELQPEALRVFNENYVQFLYPLEQVCVKNAYPRFNEWGVDNSVISTTWYMFPKEPEENYVYIIPAIGE